MEIIVMIFLAILLVYLILSVAVLFIKLLPIFIVAIIFYRIWKKFVQIRTKNTSFNKTEKKDKKN